MHQPQRRQLFRLSNLPLRPEINSFQATKRSHVIPIPPYLQTASKLTRNLGYSISVNDSMDLILDIEGDIVTNLSARIKHLDLNNGKDKRSYGKRLKEQRLKVEGIIRGWFEFYGITLYGDMVNVVINHLQDTLASMNIYDITDNSIHSYWAEATRRWNKNCANGISDIYTRHRCIVQGQACTNLKEARTQLPGFVDDIDWTPAPTNLHFDVEAQRKRSHELDWDIYYDE